MATLDDICENLITDVKDAKGAALVDLSTGLILSVAHNVSYFTQEYLDAVAASAVEMFRGDTVSAVESLLSSQRGTQVEKTIKEVQMSTDMTHHFMSTVPDKPDTLMVLITGRGANLGMGWVNLRKAISEAAPLCP